MPNCSSVRRVALLGAAAVTVATAGAAPALAAASADLAVNRAYVAGSASSAESGDSLTFVFGAKNFGPATADVSINLTTSRGLTTTSLQCVLRNGFVITPDGANCETGRTRPGQSGGHLVVTGTVTGTWNIAVTACVSNLNQSEDPHTTNNCKTLRVQVL